MTQLSDIATAALAREPGFAAAAISVRKLALGDQEIFSALMMPYLDKAVFDLLRKHKTIDNSKTPKAEAIERQKAETGKDGLASFGQRNWLSLKMFNGKTLGDSSRADLMHAIDHHTEIARVNVNHATFFKSLAQRVGNELVKDVFSNSQLTVFAGKLGL